MLRSVSGRQEMANHGIALLYNLAWIIAPFALLRAVLYTGLLGITGIALGFWAIIFRGRW